MKKIILFITVVLFTANVYASAPANPSLSFGGVDVEVNNLQYTTDLREFLEEYADDIDAFNGFTTTLSAQELLAFLQANSGSEVPDLSPDQTAGTVTFDFILELDAQAANETQASTFFGQFSDVIDKTVDFSATLPNVTFGGNLILTAGDMVFVDVYGNVKDFSRQIPIDGGLSFLALGGIAFGIARMRRKE
jgi:hypothetical protein